MKLWHVALGLGGAWLVYQWAREQQRQRQRQLNIITDAQRVSEANRRQIREKIGSAWHGGVYSQTNQTEEIVPPPPARLTRDTMLPQRREDLVNIPGGIQQYLERAGYGGPGIWE